MITIITIAATTPATIPIINPIFVGDSVGATSTVMYQRKHCTNCIYSRLIELPVSKGADKGETAHPPMVQALYATLLNDKTLLNCLHII